MSKCDKNRDILLDWTFGGSSLEGLDYDHIESCDGCRTLLNEAESIRPALNDYSVHLGQEARKLLSEAKTKRSLSVPEERLSFRRIPAWMKIAAAVVITILGTYFYSSLQPVSEEPIYFAQVQNESSRDAIQSYVGKTQMFLMSLFSEDVECGDHGDSIAVDRELAKKLVYQKRLLDPKLNSDEFRDLKPLLDQFEVLLIDIASGDGCVRSDEIELWKEVMNSRSTLLKLNLLQMEGRI